MDPIRSAYRKAWLVGGLAGLIGGLAAGILSFGAGICCLFQFANSIVPAIAGMAAGMGATALVPWGQVPPGGATATGAGVGLRAGAAAAFLSVVGAVLVSLAWPVIMLLFQALLAGDMGELVTNIVTSLVSAVVTVGMTAMFAGAGGVLGVLLGVAGGAIVGSTIGTPPAPQ